MRQWYFSLILLITCFESEMVEGHMEIFFLWDVRPGRVVSMLLAGENFLCAELSSVSPGCNARDAKPWIRTQWNVRYRNRSPLAANKCDLLWGWNTAVPSAVTEHARKGAKPKITRVTGYCLHFGHQRSLLVTVLRLLVPATKPRCHPSSVGQGNGQCQWICFHTMRKAVLNLWPRQHTLQQSPLGALGHGEKHSPWCWAALGFGLGLDLVKSKGEDYKIGTLEEDLTGLMDTCGIGHHRAEFKVSAHSSNAWECQISSLNDGRKMRRQNGGKKTYLFSFPCIRCLKRGL